MQKQSVVPVSSFEGLDKNKALDLIPLFQKATSLAQEKKTNPQISPLSKSQTCRTPLRKKLYIKRVGGVKSFFFKEVEDLPCTDAFAATAASATST